MVNKSIFDEASMLNKILVFFSCVWICGSNLLAYEFAIATMFKDEAPYLKEWIEYHLMVGADHFWLYNNLSTDNWDEVLAPYIEKGLVEILAWPPEKPIESKSGMFPFKLQAEAVKDALKRAKGKAKWLTFIDIDEFFLLKKNKTVPECLNAYFSEVSAVFVSWRSFGTNGIYIPKGEPILTRLTASARKEHDKNRNGKSIWRPEEVDVDSVWWVHWAQLNSKGKYVNGNGDDMILDGPKAGWRWGVYDEYICLNHYFFRDESFFRERRLPFAEKGWSEYSAGTLWQYHKEFSECQDFSMKNFIQREHPEIYDKYWKNYE